jgi:hypothetical protein
VSNWSHCESWIKGFVLAFLFNKKGYVVIDDVESAFDDGKYVE